METLSQALHPLGVVTAPHSLGKLIEWKLLLLIDRESRVVGTVTPHSLGKLIEWKLAGHHYSPCCNVS